MPSPAGRPLKLIVAENLDREITRRDVSNRTVGDLIGATEQQVWRWRRGIHEPTGRYAVALAEKLFGGDLGALYTDHDRQAA